MPVAAHNLTPGARCELVEHFVQTCTSDGPEQQAFVFDSRQLSEQLTEICQSLGVVCDQDNIANYWLLTNGASAKHLPLRSEVEVLAMPQQSLLGLYRATDIVRARILAVETAIDGKAAGPIRDLMSAMQNDALMVGEAIEKDAIFAILKHVTHDWADRAWAVTCDLAMACLCEMVSLCHDEATRWFEKHLDELGVLFFARLFAVIFPPEKDADSDVMLSRQPTREEEQPRATLTMCLFFLQNVPACAHHAGEAGAVGTGRRGRAGGMGPAYPAMFAAIRGEDDDEFRRSAAIAILCMMVEVAEQNDLWRRHFRNEIAAFASEQQLEELFRLDARHDHLTEELLALSIKAAADLSTSQKHTQVGLLKEVTESREKILHMQETIERLQIEIQQQHRSMCAMVPFIKVDSSLLVEQSLDSLVRFGWDSVSWRNNYSLLHFAADCLDDRRVIELMCSFCKDIDLRDDSGKRPIDYARKNACPDIATCLEQMRKVKRQDESKRKTVLYTAPARTSVSSGSNREDIGRLSQRLDDMEDIPPLLREGIEAVLTHGWDEVTWPQGFSVAHLAAQQGHRGAMELLIEAQADITAKDEWALAPLDYAAQNGHGDMIMLLQDAIRKGLGCPPRKDSLLSGSTHTCDLVKSRVSPNTSPRVGRMNSYVFSDAGRSRAASISSRPRQLSNQTGVIDVTQERTERSRTLDNGDDINHGLSKDQLESLNRSYQQSECKHRALTLSTDGVAASVCDSDFGLSSQQLEDLQRRWASCINPDDPQFLQFRKLSETSRYTQASARDSDFGFSDAQLAELRQRYATMRLTQMSAQDGGHQDDDLGFSATQLADLRQRYATVRYSQMSTQDVRDLRASIRTSVTSSETSPKAASQEIQESGGGDLEKVGQDPVQETIDASPAPAASSFHMMERSMTRDSMVSVNSYDSADFGLSDQQLRSLMGDVNWVWQAEKPVENGASKSDVKIKDIQDLEATSSGAGEPPHHESSSSTAPASSSPRRSSLGINMVPMDSVGSRTSLRSSLGNLSRVDSLRSSVGSKRSPRDHTGASSDVRKRVSFRDGDMEVIKEGERSEERERSTSTNDAAQDSGSPSEDSHLESQAASRTTGRTIKDLKLNLPGRIVGDEPAERTVASTEDVQDHQRSSPRGGARDRLSPGDCQRISPRGGQQGRLRATYSGRGRLEANSMAMDLAEFRKLRTSETERGGFLEEHRLDAASGALDEAMSGASKASRYGFTLNIPERIPDEENDGDRHFIDALSERQSYVSPRVRTPTDVKSMDPVELFTKLKRAENERAALLEERRLHLAPGNGGGVQSGGLDEAMMKKCLELLAVSGEEGVRSKLQESVHDGGLALSDKGAGQVVDMLESLLKFSKAMSAYPHGSFIDNASEFPGGGKAGIPVGAGEGIAQQAARKATAFGLDVEIHEIASASSVSDAEKSPSTDSKKDEEESAKEESETPTGKKGKKGKGGKEGKGKGAPTAPAPAAKGQGKTSGKAVRLPLTKPKLEPGVKMKPLWWVRYLKGLHLKEGETIWDLVEELMLFSPEEIEDRFCKSSFVAKKKKSNAGASDFERNENEDGPKLLRIITDPSLIAGREAALRQLPPAQELAAAIMELDEQLFTTDVLQSVIMNAVPTPEQHLQLEQARADSPHIPLAVPEQYMWVVMHIPSYKARLDVWNFVRSFNERRLQCSEGLKFFMEVVDCIVHSPHLPDLLGLVLAVGNYLNAGTDRGQADGFDIESLAKLESVKDAKGNDVRHLIFDVFFRKCPEKSSLLMQELTPLLQNVTRVLVRDPDGAEKLSKKVNVTFEDYDQLVTALMDEMLNNTSSMEAVLQALDDPSDIFKLRMPEQISNCKYLVDKLAKQRDLSKERLDGLLRYFRVSSMKSSDFCLLWDDFFIPETLIVRRPDKLKKGYLGPHFCGQSRTITADALAVLWGFEEPETVAKASSPRRPGLRSKAPTSRAARRRVSGNLTGDRRRTKQLTLRSQVQAIMAVKRMSRAITASSIEESLEGSDRSPMFVSEERT